MPAERAARGMGRRVEPVPGHRGQVDPADEGDLAVDDHELLVMTVQRPLARVERDVNAGPVGERAPDRVDLASVRAEQRQRRTGPREEANVDSPRHVCEQLPQRPRIPVVEAELRREEPTREPHRRAGALDRPRDLRQRIGAVHEHIEGVAGDRQPGRGPTAGRRCERKALAEPLEPAPMMSRPRAARVAALLLHRPLREARVTAT